MRNRQPKTLPELALAFRASVRRINQSEADVDRIPNTSDLTHEEMKSLRLIVSRSFMSKSTLPEDHRARLILLGLIQTGMGGLMPTPAGRIAARG